MTAPVAAVFWSLLSLHGAAGSVIQSDTILDPDVRVVLERAREARQGTLEGIESYEGVMRERIHIGIPAFRFRRARTLFDQERIARLRWEREGGRFVEWVGARRRIPVAGSTEEVQDALAARLVQSLLAEGAPPALAFAPWADRLVFGESWFEHPLADSAEVNYRFSLGDTISLTMPGNPVVTAIELRIEPTRADAHLLDGSLWFDQNSGALVRATYRPATPFDFELDASPEDSDNIPAVIEPLTAEISTVTMEYSLHGGRFWLASGFTLEGTGTVGELARIPLTVDWTVSEQAVNGPPEMPLTGALPPGWTRSVQSVSQGGTEREVTVILPPTDSVTTSSALSERSAEDDASADSEMDEVRNQLDRLLPRSSSPRFFVRTGLGKGATKGLTRFNRVEGLSLGAAVQLPVSGEWGLYAEARLGTADVEPNGEISLFNGDVEDRFAVTAYRRLDYASDWRDPFRLSRSLRAVITGGDHGQFYRTLGVEASKNTEGRFLQHSVRLFFEQHTSAEKETGFYLGDLFGDTDIDELITAEEGTIGGGEMDLRWQVGFDPDGLVASGRTFLEGGVGDFDYWRWGASSALVRPLGNGLFGGVEGGLGMASSGAPLQRQFFLGGSATFRGLDSGAERLRGSSFWFGRSELARDTPLARIALFGDVAWAGAGQRIGSEGWLSSVGAGFSVLDGLFRIDVARVIRGPNKWKVDLNLEGLL